MSSSTALTLITDAATDFGGAILVILGAVIVIGVGVLVFRFGWSKVKKAHR